MTSYQNAVINISFSLDLVVTLGVVRFAQNTTRDCTRHDSTKPRAATRVASRVSRRAPRLGRSMSRLG